MRRCTRSLVLSSILLLAAPGLAHAGTKVAASKIKVISGKQGCALISGKFVPVKIGSKSGSQYNVSRVSGSAALKAACSSATKARNTLSSLAEIPSPATFIAKKSSSRSLGIQAVSGTAPTLSEIAGGSVDQIFWRSGVISSLIEGADTTNSCNEFFNSSSDGASGGFGACYMAQGVGQAFESLLQGAASACYMKNFPSAANVAAGGVEVVSGTLPNNDITKLFDPPATGSRLVKVNVNGSPGGQSEGNDEGPQQVIMKIASVASNTSAGNRYKAELFFCAPGTAQPQGYERTVVKENGLYTSESIQGNGKSKLEAYLLASNGSLIFDASQNRTATMTFSHGQDSMSKTSIVVSPTNELTMKSYDIFQGSDVRKAYTIAKFSGTSIADLRFLSGAFKETNLRDGSEQYSGSGATEYRDSYYAAAPNSSLLDDVSGVSLSSGSFYSVVPSVDSSMPTFNCVTAEADIEVNLNMDNETVQASVADCESERLENMDFCRNETLSQAVDGFYQHCVGPQE